MLARLSYPPAPAQLKAYAVQFDPLPKMRVQRKGLRKYPSGLLLPRERSKTLDAWVGAESLIQAQADQVQRREFFLMAAPLTVQHGQQQVVIAD